MSMTTTLSACVRVHAYTEILVHVATAVLCLVVAGSGTFLFVPAHAHTHRFTHRYAHKHHPIQDKQKTKNS